MLRMLSLISYTPPFCRFYLGENETFGNRTAAKGSFSDHRWLKRNSTEKWGNCPFWADDWNAGTPAVIPDLAHPVASYRFMFRFRVYCFSADPSTSLIPPLARWCCSALSTNGELLAGKWEGRGGDASRRTSAAFRRYASCRYVYEMVFFPPVRTRTPL